MGKLKESLTSSSSKETSKNYGTTDGSDSKSNGKKISVAVILLDVIFLIVLLGSCKIILNNITGQTLGFFCDDETIQYTPSNDTTVSTLQYYTIAPAITLLQIVSTEVLLHPSDTTEPHFVLGGLKLHDVLVNLYKHVGMFIYGSLLANVMSGYSQLSGRLSPTFLYSCQPDPLSYNCSGGYVQNYTCLNENEDEINDARKSFPSADATFIWFTAFNLMFYAIKRVTPKQPSLLAHLLPLVGMMMATWGSITQVTSHIHHIEDVVAGGLIGTAIAVYVHMEKVWAYKDNTEKTLFEENDETGDEEDQKPGVSTYQKFK